METRRAIIVEDEPDHKDRLVQLLNEFPQISIVESAASVGEAITAIRQHRPDLVFMDVKLGTGTCFEILEGLLNFLF